MILRDSDGITIETYVKDEIEKLKSRGFVSIYSDKSPLAGKKKAPVQKRSTRGTKGKRST